MGARVAAITASASAPANCAATVRTWAANAAWSANGSAAQTRSSSEQPSARSGLSAFAAHPLGHASATTPTSSAAPPPSASPPPVTVAVRRTVAAAALPTATVTVIGGYAAPAASTSLRVQRLVAPPVHVQPGPEAATGPAPAPGWLTSALRPAGSVSVTVTALPSVGSAPVLATRSISTAGFSVVFGACARSSGSRA